MSYTTVRDGVAKTPCVVWEFPEITTRFVTRNHALLVNPNGWTVFEGAVSETDQGSSVEISSGKLTIGGCSFNISDVNGLVTAWLCANDSVLCETPVTRKHGFIGVSESEYHTDYWILEDWGVEDKGGGYRIVLANVLRGMSRGCYADIEGESYQLNADLAPATTTITLQKSPKGYWREPGYCILHSRDKFLYELVYYTSIGGTGNKDLQTCTRRKFGVGDNSYTFLSAGTEVVQVWAKRDNPINVMLELLTTGSGSGITQHLGNSDFDSWDSSTLLSAPWVQSISGGAGSINRDTGYLERTYSARMDRTGAGGVTFYQDHSSACTPGEYSAVSIYAKGVSNLAVEIYNVTRLKYLQADGTWAVGSASRLITPVTQWRPYFIGFLVDATFNATDNYRVKILHTGQNGESAWLGEVELRSGWTRVPNGPWDLNTGDGVGDYVSQSWIAVSDILNVRDEFWPEPTWSGDAVVSGVANLFVEKDVISDVKDYVEDYILRPFGLFPVINVYEQFAVETCYRAAPNARVIDNEWMKDKFNASRFLRSYTRKINQIRLKSDWGVVDGSHGYATIKNQETSVANYGTSKETDVIGRGCRSGRLGFPDYGNVGHMQTGASRYLLEVANPASEFEVLAFYKHRDIGIADAVQLNLPAVPNLMTGVRGINGESFLVIGRKLDDRDGNVAIKVKLRRPVSRPAFIASDGVSATYSTASASDRLYCYILPSGLLTFSDNSEPYTVIP